MSQLTETSSLPLRFVVTVDTEADNAWTSPDEIRLRNILELPKFQELCEKFRVVPTYLLTYECAHRDEALQVIRPLVETGHCEIGHHLHVWSCPPFSGDAGDDVDRQWLLAHQFLLPSGLFEEKAERLRKEIQLNLGRSPTSHRAGRWGVDQRTVNWLISAGFEVETSIRPSIRLPGNRGAFASTSYSFDRSPYTWGCEPKGLHRGHPLLEIPVTVAFPDGIIPRSCRQWLARGFPFESGIERVYRRLGGMRMLRPDPSLGPGSLPAIIDSAIHQGVPVINLMLHSSELALGCSPFTRSRDDVHRIWGHLREAFEYISRQDIVSDRITEVARLVGHTPLKEFAA